MKLKDLVQKLERVKVLGSTEIEILDVTIDSSAVTKGSLFICINGKGFDSHNFIRQVEMYGAVAVVTEKIIETTLTQIVVKDTRRAMSIIAGEFFGRVDKKLKIIGVTGTNGKTTTTHIIKSIFDNAKINCGLIGTLGAYYNDKKIETGLTTPDPLCLHKIFKTMYDDGVEVVVMEVSAHALFFNKLENIEFEAVVFTNLSQDHLDFFDNLEDYKKAKLKLFSEHKCKYIISNSDDLVGREIAEQFLGVITFGINNPSDVFAVDLKESKNGSKFIINLFDCVYNVNTKLIGEFNVYNLLAASSVCAILGVNTEKIVDSIKNFKGVNGRLELVYKNEFSVFVDYAHTPDGLEKSLKALKPLFKRLICVFGCGGNRDAKKREVMGKISGEIADFTVITSDNPRFEEPMDIISQIEKGVLSVTKNYVAVQDRVEGIKYALEMATIGDAVLIAGKGGENYQEVLGIKRLYNDKDTVISLIRSEEV